MNKLRAMLRLFDIETKNTLIFQEKNTFDFAGVILDILGAKL